MPAVSEKIRVIHASDVTDFVPWQLPSFDRAENEAVQETPPAIEETPAAPLIDEEGLQALRDKAYREGFAKGEQAGFAAGEKKAAEETKQQLAQHLASLETLMQALFEPIAQQDAQIEALLLDLLQRLTRAVIRRELSTDSSQVLPHLREALALLPMGASNLHLLVSPQDFASIKALRDHHNEHWRICEDPDLLPGGFRLQADNSRIDASIETRLEQALSQIFTQQREQRLNPPAPDMSATLSPVPATLSPSPSPAGGRGESPVSAPAEVNGATQSVSDPIPPPKAAPNHSPRPLAGEGEERASDAT